MKRFLALLWILIAATGVKAGAADQPLILRSPDGKTEIRITTAGTVSYSVWYRNKEIVSGSAISLTVGGSTLGHNATVKSVQRHTVNEVIRPLYGKTAILNDRYNDLRIDFTQSFSLECKAYDEGIAWRWITALGPNEITVDAEEANITLDRNSAALLSVTPKITTWELPYTAYPSLSEVPDSVNVILPGLFSTGGLRVVSAESDLHDYPGMFLKKTATGFQGFWATHAKKETPYGGDWGMSTKVDERDPYLARTSGNRSFPWRVIILAEDDKELLTNQLVYKLAAPSQLEDLSWIRPGKCDWEWWHDAIVNDAGFPTGMKNRSTKLYKHYIDFAADHGLEYTLIDAGWSNFYHLDSAERVDINELVAYGKEKHVGLIVWCNATSLAADLDRYMAGFGAWGLKGIKVDFFDRDDQEIIQLQERIARAAAKYHLLVDFHGSSKPTGWSRTYPNVINYEAVRGEECSKWDTTSNPQYHVQIPFIRMLAGDLDYTPGSMRNRTRTDFVPIPKGLPSTLGTRCHELALFVVFDQFLAVLSDSPEAYRKYPDIMSFLSAVPVSYDDTRILEARLGEYVTLAKRKNNTWYVGALTNWTGRDQNIDCSFLGEGSWQAQIFKDGTSAATDAESYQTETISINRHSKLHLHLAPGGGTVIKISKASI